MTTKQVPITALRMTGIPLKFRGNSKPEVGSDIPVTMLARTADPIDHWYWGKVAHDLAGMSVASEIPIDYCHDSGEVLGFADTFTVTDDGLETSGSLIPFSADDRATEVAHKAARGVPYQASIDFSQGEIAIEQVPENHFTTVNGREFEGPGIIIRKWTLGGVAICPYGADPGTSTTFANDASEATVTVLQTTEEVNPMTVETNATTETTSSEALAPVVDHFASYSQQLKRYADRFGATNGVEWFSAGKTWEQALDLHCQSLEASGKQLTATIHDLQAKLAAFAGVESPVDSMPEEADRNGKKPFKTLFRMAGSQN